MDVNSGHLLSEQLYKKLRELGEPVEEPKKEPEALDLEEQLERQRVLDELKASVDKLSNYEPVPEELNVAAQKKLAGKDEAMVSLTSGGKLSKWAAKTRKEKRKAQRAARKRNKS